MSSLGPFLLSKWPTRLPKYSKITGVVCRVMHEEMSLFRSNRGFRLAAKTLTDANHWK